VSDREDLWQEIHASLEWRMPSTDSTTEHRLNRLAREYFPDLKRTLNKASCATRRETLTTEALNRLKTWHRRASPAKYGGSVILFSHEGEVVVIDGNNRLNAHRADCATTPVSAIVISFRD
jgi:hypothetical protein